MPAKVEHCKRADVSHSIDMNGKLAEKVDDRSGAGWKGEPQDERCEEDGQELREEDADLEGEERAEFGVDLFMSAGELIQ